MAVAYPEGECFFKRSSLAGSLGLEPDSSAFQQWFYRHALIEYHWNQPNQVQTPTRPGDAAKYCRSHPRSRETYGVIGKSPTSAGIYYYYWDRTAIAFSSGRDTSTMKYVKFYKHNSNVRLYQDYNHNKAPRQYILRPIWIYSDANWMWVDSTMPIRAIYFPLCWKTDEAFPDYCTYVAIDFRARNLFYLWNRDQQGYTPFSSSPEIGISKSKSESESVLDPSLVDLVEDLLDAVLASRTHWVFGFDIPGIIAYLALPRQVRNPERGLFHANAPGQSFIHCLPADKFSITGSGVKNDGEVEFSAQIDLAEIICANFGVSIGWRPYGRSNFMDQLLVDLCSFGLGYLPVIGPLASVAFGMAMQATEDPDFFKEDLWGNLLHIGLAVGASGASLKSWNILATNSMSPRLRGYAGARAAPLSEEQRQARAKAVDAENARITEALRAQYPSGIPEKNPPSWKARLPAKLPFPIIRSEIFGNDQEKLARDPTSEEIVAYLFKKDLLKLPESAVASADVSIDTISTETEGVQGQSVTSQGDLPAKDVVESGTPNDQLNGSEHEALSSTQNADTETKDIARQTASAASGANTENTEDIKSQAVPSGGEANVQSAAPQADPVASGVSAENAQASQGQAATSTGGVNVQGATSLADPAATSENAQASQGEAAISTGDVNVQSVTSQADPAATGVSTENTEGSQGQEATLPGEANVGTGPSAESGL